MSGKVSPVVEGGLLTAIAVILGLASVYLPVFGVFVEFFCAVPIVVLTVRQGAQKGALSLVASFLLLTMFVGPILSMRIALSFGICGLVLGFCVAKGFSAVRCFVAALIISFVAQFIAVGILSAAMEINFMDTEISAVREAFDESLKMYEEMGVDQKALEQIREQITPTLELLKFLLPTILFFMALLNAVACYLTAQWIFKKLRLKFVEPMPNFAEWRFPKIFLYVTAFAILGVYWGSTRGWELLYTISVNATFLTMSAGFLQGLAVLSYVAERHNVSTWLRRVIFVIIILNGLLIEIVAFTGIFDMIFDYRTRFFNSGGE